eukprot:169347-Pleurochrysis_carterae.AAC.1
MGLGGGGGCLVRSSAEGWRCGQALRTCGGAAVGFEGCQGGGARAWVRAFAVDVHEPVYMHARCQDVER